MIVSRRTCLTVAGAGVWQALARAERGGAPPVRDIAARVRQIVGDFSDQGFHRTGTAVDRRSGDWLVEEVHRAGATAAREPFSLSRVDPVDCRLMIDGERLEGLPLFDGAFTGADGVHGTLGPIDADVEIGLVEAPPNTAGAGVLGEARRRGRHRAIVCITRGGRPGLCPNNADAFLEPFGPPVLQLSSEHGPLLRDRAARRSPVQVIAAVTRTPSTSFNVVTTIRGSDNGSGPPLVVMTPRSGWYWCASERGGGIACWLELIRAFAQSRPPRDVVFVASSGHELGHLGINAFVDNRPGIVPRAAGWMHFGANIGAAVAASNPIARSSDDPQARHATAATGGAPTIQASDDEREATLAGALTTAHIAIGRRVPRGTVPGGEAEVVHVGHGRYVSVIGGNALFHNPSDRGADTVDAAAVAAFVDAFVSVANAFATGRA